MGNNTDLQIANFIYDDDLIEAVQRDHRPCLRIYHLPQTMIVLGRGSKPALELDIATCMKDQIPLFRRRGGGCAVLIDPDNVIISLVLPAPGIGQSLWYFERISAWIASALKEVGLIGIHREGSSDLALGDRKIGGACIYRAKGMLYYSATLLVNPDISLMERYLCHPPREPAYRQSRAHRDFVQAIGPLLGILDTRIFVERLEQLLHITQLNLDH